MVKKFILEFCTALAIGACGGENLLSTLAWRAVSNGGASLSLRQLDNGAYELERSGQTGNTLFLPKAWLPVKPDTDYEVTVRFHSETPGADASIMLQTNDKTRTPYPRSDAAAFTEAAGDLIFGLKTRLSENQLNLMIPLAHPGKIVIERVELNETGPQTNLLRDVSLRFGTRIRGGADGKIEKLSGGAFRLVRNNEEGELILLNEINLKLTPGKYYAAAVKVKAGAPGVAVRLMLQMPGSPRRPFPTQQKTPAVGEEVTIRLPFQAQPEEEALRMHVFLLGKGSVDVLSLECREISKEEYDALLSGEKLTRYECSGKALGAYVETVGPIRELSSAEFPDAIVRGGAGGFACAVDWDADAVKQVEADFRAFEEPGALRLDFTTVRDGKEYHSFQTASMPPDGEFHTIRFPVSHDPVWNGRVCQLKFTWQNIYANVRISLSALRGLSTDNLVVDASSIFRTGKLPVSLLRPRGKYELSRAAGDTPGFELFFFNGSGRRLGSAVLKDGTPKIIFQAPELLADAELVTTGKSGGAPVIRLVELPVLDRTAFSWKGQWIWSRNGEGPLDTKVFFKRELTLSSPPVTAVLSGTADDKLTAVINGTRIPVTEQWDHPQRVDLTSALHAGANEVILEATNFQAWGGVLADIFIRCTDGRQFYVTTGPEWVCREGESGEILHPVHVIGPVPAMPWGTRLANCYAGPQVKATFEPCGNETAWTVKTDETPEVDTDKLEFSCTMPDGSRQTVQGKISPSTGNWEKGEAVRVTVTLPALQTLKGGTAKVFPDSPLFKATGEPAEAPVAAAVSHPLSDLHIIGAGKRMWFVINGKRIPPFYYDLPSNFISSPEQRDLLVAKAVQAGCQVIRMAQSVRDIWKGADHYDFSPLDRALGIIAANAPGVHLILVSATYMPEWWLKENPGEAVKFFGNEPPAPTEDFQSIASQKWLSAVSGFYARLVQHLRCSPYAGMIVGIAPVDGVTWEWIWNHGRGHQGRVYSGWSEAGLAAYRAWLRTAYRNSDAALASAWNRPGAQIDRALPPEPGRLDEASVGDLLDPARDRDLIDWSTFRNDCLSDAWLAVCRMVKTETDGKWLAGSYYGYLNTFSWMYYHLQDGGHLRISKVARSSDADFVYGPTMYHWRALGGADGLMQPAEAFSSHGKAVIAELDQRTFTEPVDYEARNGRMSTVGQSISAMNRAFGMLAARGAGGHWMELYERWFREPVLLDVIRRQIELYASLPEKISGAVPCETTILSDEDSAFYTRTNMGGLHVPLIAEVLRKMPETAVPFRHVLKEDLLEDGVLPGSKLYIITNLLVLSAPEREMLMRRFAQEKAVVLWLYAPGVFFPDRGPSAENLSELLGIRFSMDTTRRPLKMSFLNPARWGTKSAECLTAVAPWFRPESGYDEVIAQTSDGRPAMVKWSKNGVVNYFSMVPNLPPAVLRSIASEAGVQVWSESGDPLWLGNDFVTLHAKTGGIKQIKTPKGVRLLSVLGPELGVLPENGTFPAVAGSTYVFVAEKKQ